MFSPWFTDHDEHMAPTADSSLMIVQLESVVKWAIGHWRKQRQHNEWSCLSGPKFVDIHVYQYHLVTGLINTHVHVCFPSFTSHLLGESSHDSELLSEFYETFHVLITGLILGLCPANGRRRYFVMTSLIGWAQA